MSEETRAPFRRSAPGMFRTRLLITYDGTDFAGWQRQNQTHVKTVQGTLEGALSTVFAQRITVLGASRTDAGVHAEGQVAHFDAPRDPSLFDLRFSLQSLTPPSLVVREIYQAPDDFHAIASSIRKKYRYVIVNRRVPSALRHRYSWWIRYPLDPDFLNEAAQKLLGEHDFKAFQTSGSDVKTTVRQIYSAEWVKKPNDTVELTIVGNGFLKQMVRNIVGTLVQMNQLRLPPEHIQKVLAGGDRRKAGATAPPQGLYLAKVYYPDALDKKCRKLYNLASD